VAAPVAVGVGSGGTAPLETAPLETNGAADGDGALEAERGLDGDGSRGPDGGTSPPVDDGPPEGVDDRRAAIDAARARRQQRRSGRRPHGRSG
jgi:hypothetical protein